MCDRVDATPSSRPGSPRAPIGDIAIRGRVNRAQKSAVSQCCRGRRGRSVGVARSVWFVRRGMDELCASKANQFLAEAALFRSFTIHSVLHSSKSPRFHPHVPRARAPQQLLFWGNTCVSVVAPFPHVFPCLNSSVDNDVDDGCDDICLIPLAHFSFLRQSRAAGRQDPAPQLSRETNMSCRFEHLQLGIHDHEEALKGKGQHIFVRPTGASG